MRTFFIKLFGWMLSQERDPYREGSNAYYAGCSGHANPYRHGSSKYVAWRAGYMGRPRPKPRDI